jgi:hypothetical protein
MWVTGSDSKASTRDVSHQLSRKTVKGARRTCEKLQRMRPLKRIREKEVGGEEKKRQEGRAGEV